MHTNKVVTDSALLPYGIVAGYGYVYVVGKHEHGPTKIGITTNARKRVIDLENANGERFRHIWVSDRCSNFAAIEKQLHEKFSKYRTVGEWFFMPFALGMDAAAECQFDLMPTDDWDKWLKIANMIKPPPQHLCDAAKALEERM